VGQKGYPEWDKKGTLSAPERVPVRQKGNPTPSGTERIPYLE